MTQKQKTTPPRQDRNATPNLTLARHNCCRRAHPASPGRLAALCLAGLAVLAGCDAFNWPTDTCPGDDVPSVILRIQDASNNVLTNASTRFRINGGQWYYGACTGTCNEVKLVYEITGTINIEVSAPGYLTASHTTTVVKETNGCHPVTKSLTITMQRDLTVGALAGAWVTTQSFFGHMALRFNSEGKIVGAILYDRTIAGDRNLYVEFNGRQIVGVSGQPIYPETATEPTRGGDIFNFTATTLSQPIGFTNAAISTDYNTLTGTLNGAPITYVRLQTIPNALQSPS